MLQCSSLHLFCLREADSSHMFASSGPDIGESAIREEFLITTSREGVVQRSLISPTSLVATLDNLWTPKRDPQHIERRLFQSCQNVLIMVD